MGSGLRAAYQSMGRSAQKTRQMRMRSPDTAGTDHPQILRIPAQEKRNSVLWGWRSTCRLFIRGAQSHVTMTYWRFRGQSLQRRCAPHRNMQASRGNKGTYPGPAEYAGPCTAPGVICAKVHETADGPVLALDLWARRLGLCAQEFLTGREPACFLAGRRINDKGPFKAADATPLHGHPGRRKRMEAFFNIRGNPRSGEIDLCRAWPAQRMALLPAGAEIRGGYAPEELFRTGCQDGVRAYMLGTRT